MTIIDFMQKFDSENACIESLIQERFSDGEYCLKCGDKNVYSFSDGKRWKCRSCKRIFNIKCGTIFEGSKVPLRTWYLAMFLMCSTKKGISSIQLGKQIGVTQKTAWKMAHKIRSTYKQRQKKLSGYVEIDETYVGGKQKNKHKNKKIPNCQGRSCKGKTPIIGMIERGGTLFAQTSSNVRRKTIKKIVKRWLSKDGKLIADEYQIYNTISERRVFHSAGQYVIGRYHTNTIEGFWSLLKRGIIGVYHRVSPKYLQKYVDEFVFRYNNRDRNIQEQMRICIGGLQ